MRFGTHIVTAERNEHLEQLHRPAGPLGGKLERRIAAQALEPAEGPDTEWPGPTGHAQRRRVRREPSVAHQRARKVRLDLFVQRQHTELRQRPWLPARRLTEPIFLSLLECGANASQRSVSVARAPGRFACGKLRRVAQPRTAQAFGDGFCTAQLRLHAATVGSTHLDLSKNDPRQTLEPRDAGLDCDGKRHLRLALRVRDIAVEDREPRAEVMHACPIAATQPRAPTLETLQRSPRLATVAAAELRDRADGEPPRIVRMNSLGAARRQG